MKTPSALLLLTCYLGFISLGLPDTLLGVAWPFVRHEFALPQTAAAAAFIAMGCAYALSGSAAGRLLASLGTGRLLIVSSAAVTLAVFGFATTPAWILFVLCTIIHGFGSGAIDTGLNDFVSRRFSASHMNWLHACFSLGAAAGPAIMTGAVQNQGAWRMGYFIVGGVLSLLTLLFFLTRAQWTEPASASTPPPVRAPLMQTLAQPAVRWHLLLFFVYAGIESTVGQWSFTLLTESRHLSTALAGGLVTTYWTAIFLGRILSGFLVPRTGSARLVRFGIAGAALASFLLLPSASPVLALLSLLLTGLALAPIFPCLMTLTPERAGAAHSANAIGLQVTAATLGIAVWPSLASLTAQLAGPGALPVLFAGMAILLLALHEIGPVRAKGLRVPGS
ncbi:MAG: Permease of the major facilitator superfamily [Verrucomicrobiales bacterium]|nr:Permease of the major facilitator superfamily [Verrucomicrobiales bacterium]